MNRFRKIILISTAYWMVACMSIPSLHAISWNSLKNQVSKPVEWLQNNVGNSKGWEITKRVVRKPTTWAVTGGLLYAGHTLGGYVGDKRVGYGAVGLGYLLWNIPTFLTWFSLRNQWIDLLQQHTGVSDPSVRNVWSNPLDKEARPFEDGYHMMSVFNSATSAQKVLVRDSLMKQVGAQNDLQAMAAIDGALAKLKTELDRLSQYTNVMYILSSASGFSVPSELITSDVLIENSLDGALKNVYERSIEYGLYSLHLDWSTTYDMPYPIIYKWTYAMAGRCVWLILKDYSFLKAIRKIMEQVIEDNASGAQKHIVTLLNAHVDSQRVA